MDDSIFALQRMRRHGTNFAALVASLYFVACSAAALGAEKQFTPVFNGKNLDGWVVDGKNQKDDTWTVADGIIRCAGGGFGYLRYDKKLCDFTVRLQYRMSKGCNSGIGIRGVVFTGPGKTRPSFASYEIQILDDAGKPTNTHSSMSLYRYVAPTENAVKPAGEWNQVEITCVGPRIKIALNGKTVQDIDQTTVKSIKDKPLCGYFMVQNHGKPIEFRQVELLEREPAAKSAEKDENTRG